MGMFDDIVIPCPHCGKGTLEQTKGGDCTLAHYQLADAPLDAVRGLDDVMYCAHCEGTFTVAVYETEDEEKIVVSKYDKSGSAEYKREKEKGKKRVIFHSDLTVSANEAGKVASFSTDDCEVTYRDDQDVRDAVFNRLIAWYREQEAFNGESICQCDGPIIDAPNVLSDIADNIIKFEVKDNG